MSGRVAPSDNESFDYLNDLIIFFFFSYFLFPGFETLQIVDSCRACDLWERALPAITRFGAIEGKGIA